MWKRKLKNFITAILFLAVFLLVFNGVTNIFRQKAGANDTTGSFYKEAKDSIDVIYAGASHSYRAFNPMVTWEEAGITSYNMGTQSQSIPVSYYLLKEAIRTQHPKVIVLEAYGAAYMEDYVQDGLVHKAVDGMPLNRTKFEFLTEFLPNTLENKDIVGFALPLVSMHNRWEELRTEDFIPSNQFMKGYQYTALVNAVEKPEMIDESVDIYDRTILYFDKIIDLCRENNVELVLTVAPLGDGDRYEEICKRINCLLGHAKELNVPIVDLHRMAEELNIEYDHDFYNAEHVNAYGGEKCTKYMVQYLKENYNLEDHRGEAKYRKWEDCYQEYLTYLSEEHDASPDDM